jgi:predicted amidophosphoribosyltransferase
MSKDWPKEFSKPTLIPIPSSSKNYRKRGYHHILKLTAALEKRIPEAKSACLLRSVGDRDDQASLTPAERLTNLEGAFSVDLRGFSPGGSPIVLVDDVITSGATVHAAQKALEEAGVNVAGFCVFAETRPRTR